MDHSDSMAVRVVERLLPFLAGLGFTEVKKYTRQGRPFRVEVLQPRDDLGLGLRPRFEVYESDAYPNDRDEVFVCVWNTIGMGPNMMVKNVANKLTGAGLPTRATSHRKTRGLRVTLPGLIEEWSKEHSRRVECR